MKSKLLLVGSLGIALITAVAHAQTLPTVSGQVTKIDASAGKLTLSHGPIPNLDMGEMTMVFKAGEPGMLKSVKAGDKVRFSADRVNGQLTVVKIEKAR